jgi:hypothetical protein
MENLESQATLCQRKKIIKYQEWRIQISILAICFIFFLCHSVACDSGFSILDIRFRVTGNTIPEKEDKTNIRNGESRVTSNTIPEKEDKANI